MKRLMVGLVVLSLGLFTLGCGGGDSSKPVKKDTKGTTSTAPSTTEKPAEKPK